MELSIVLHMAAGNVEGFSQEEVYETCFHFLVCSLVLRSAITPRLAFCYLVNFGFPSMVTRCSVTRECNPVRA